MLDFKKCPKCSNLTSRDNYTCPFCGEKFDESNKNNSCSRPVFSNQDKKSISHKSQSNTTIPLGITLLLIICFFLIIIPTKTVTKDVEISYVINETVNEKIPYETIEPYQDQEPYQEMEKTIASVKKASGGEYFNKCYGACSCTHYSFNNQIKPSEYCDECTCYEYEYVSKNRSVTNYRKVTKYNEVPVGTQEVTKTRTEPRQVEVNWIFGFDVPFAFHIIPS
jgi:hypothetical protein